MNSKAMQVKVQREKESCNGTMKENRNINPPYISKFISPGMVWYILIKFLLDVILQYPLHISKFISDTANLNLKF